MFQQAHSLVKIAQVLKSNGTDGELVIGFRDIAPEDIRTEEPVFIYFDGLPVPFFFDSFQKRGSSKVLARLTDIRNQEDAEEIVGQGIYASEDSLEMEYDENDFSFLVGWTLQDPQGQVKGEITDFLDIPNNPCLEVTTEKGELIVPLHNDLIDDVDEPHQILKMALPEGLEDLD